MALTTVVNDGFFERLMPVLSELDRDPQTGPLTLVMLIPSSVDENYRSLVVASDRFDQMDSPAATRLVRSRLRQELGDESVRIDNVSVLRTDHRAIRTLSKAYQVPQLGTAYQALGAPATSFDLDHPILLLSRHLATAA